MIVENVIVHDDLTFEDYLKIPLISFSSLKEAPVKESEGMRIGSLVHRYLLAPHLYKYEHADIVIPIASALINWVGRDVLRLMVCEKPTTADFVHDGFRLPWKGVPDMRIDQVVVADFKVLNGNLKQYCERFNYPDQLRGYMLPFQVDLGLIIAYNRKAKRVEIEPVHKDATFWENVCLTHGEVITMNKNQVA